MAVGSPIDVMTDIMFTTPPGFATDEETFVNEGTLRNYVTKKMRAGNELSSFLQGGESIRDDIFFDAANQTQTYDPNEPLTYKLVNTLTQHQAPWTFKASSVSWTVHEIGLNFGQLRSSAKKKRFKHLYKTKMMQLYTDISNSEEQDAWRQPSAAMEQTNGKVLQSIPHFLNEFTNGLAPGVSTIQQLAPGTYPKWVPTQQTYTGLGAGGDGLDQVRNLFTAMTRVWRSMYWQPMPHGAEYSDPETKPTFVACSLNGIAMYENGLRLSNELLLGNRQDPAYPDPMFRGMPVHYFEQLDDALLYNNGGAFASEATAAIPGPRFYIMNVSYGKRYWHEDRYFTKVAPFSPTRQPFTKIMVCDSWGNYFVNSRRKFGAIVYPTTAAVATAAYTA